MSNYIRFVWPMKRLLRDKANFAVLEGLITTLLGEKMTIQKLLESESNDLQIIAAVTGLSLDDILKL